MSRAVNVIEQHLVPEVLGVYLYGSAVEGGLKPYSDIDLLVAVTTGFDDVLRQALAHDLLKISAQPGESKIFRALEVTVVVRDDVVPWRYPARREFQFGEWQRNQIQAGIFEPAVIDPDLAILLTKVRQKSIALAGPPAENLFDSVPADDFYRVLLDTLKLWNSAPDWEGDERNVVLTLARIWYSATSGKIAAKDVAADWAIQRLPAEHQTILFEAQQAWLGYGEDHLAACGDQVAAFICYVKNRIVSEPGMDGSVHRR